MKACQHELGERSAIETREWREYRKRRMANRAYWARFTPYRVMVSHHSGGQTVELDRLPCDGCGNVRTYERHGSGSAVFCTACEGVGLWGKARYVGVTPDGHKQGPCIECSEKRSACE